MITPDIPDQMEFMGGSSQIHLYDHRRTIGQRDKPHQSRSRYLLRFLTGDVLVRIILKEIKSGGDLPSDFIPHSHQIKVLFGFPLSNFDQNLHQFPRNFIQTLRWHVAERSRMPKKKGQTPWKDRKSERETKRTRNRRKEGRKEGKKA